MKTATRCSLVEEVGAAAARRDQLLRVARQPALLLGRAAARNRALEVGVGALQQGLEVFVARSGRGRCAAPSQRASASSASLIVVPVEQAVVALVAVAEQAVVAGCLAPLADPGRVARDPRRCRGRSGRSSSASRATSASLRRVVEQAAQDAGAALGGLEEHSNLRAQLLGRERLGGQLLLLELEDGLDPALERRLERGHLALASSCSAGFEQQAVAVIFDERDHAPGGPGHRVLAASITSWSRQLVVAAQ